MDEITLDVSRYSEDIYIILNPPELKNYLLQDDKIFAKLVGNYEEFLNDSDMELLRSKNIEVEKYKDSQYQCYVYTKQREIENVSMITDEIFNPYEIKVEEWFVRPDDVIYHNYENAHDILSKLDGFMIMENRPRNFAIRTILKRWQLPIELIDLFFRFYPDDLQILIEETDCDRKIISCVEKISIVCDFDRIDSIMERNGNCTYQPPSCDRIIVESPTNFTVSDLFNLFQQTKKDYQACYHNGLPHGIFRNKKNITFDELKFVLDHKCKNIMKYDALPLLIQ